MVVSGSGTMKKAQQPTLKSFFTKNADAGSSKKPSEGPSSPPSAVAAEQEQQQHQQRAGKEEEKKAKAAPEKKKEEEEEEEEAAASPAAPSPAKAKATEPEAEPEPEQPAAEEQQEKRERRSKKGEDKKAPPAPTAEEAAPSAPAPAPAPAPKPAAAARAAETEQAAPEAGGKSRKRLRKVAADEDSDDDLLLDGAGGEKEKEKQPAVAAAVAAAAPVQEKGSSNGNGSASKKAKANKKEAAAAAAAPMDVVGEEKEGQDQGKEKQKEKDEPAPAPMDEDEDEEEGEQEEDEGDEEASSASASAAAASAAASSAKAASSSSKASKSLLTMTSKGKGTGKSSGPAASTKAILAQLAELKPGTYPSLSYRALTDVLDAVEAVSGRLEITDIVRALLAKTVECCPPDLPVLLYLLCGKIYPAYKGVELGIGDKILFEALKTGLGASPKTLQQHIGDDGDLGIAAQKCKAAQRTLGFGRAPKPLTCKEVLDGFREIAACSGNKSQEKKIAVIRKLLLNCAKDGSEVKFIVRGLQTKLRCRLAEPTVLTALAQALVLQKPAAVAEAEEKEQAEAEAEAEEQEEEDEGPLAKEVKVLKAANSGRQAKFEAAEVVVKQAYSECPNYDELVTALLSAPLPEVLKRCRLQPGVPVKPMLAKPQDSFQEVLKRMQGLHFTMEYKYDGERAQIHKLPSGEIKIFSRNSEDTTGKYPDVVAALPQAIREGTTSFVIDAEAVAIDPKTGKLLPFQILSTRKRKAESEADIKVQVVVYAFDVLYLNDRPVLQETLVKRRALLREAFTAVPGKFDFAIALDHHEDGDTSPIEAFLDEAVQGNCEGLMIKTLEQNATYEPTKRSLNWLKLKKDYLTGANGKGPADSLDLVVIGANHGLGKRTGWYGAFLLACYDPEAEEYQSVCKIGTGFSEEFLAKVKPQLDALVVPAKPGYYSTGLECDVWLEPKTTWEVRAADLSKSSVHKGALHKVESGKGIALRFPRFIRERADKNPEDATNAEQVAEAYRSQALAESTEGKGKGKGKGGGNEEEDDGDWCI